MNNKTKYGVQIYGCLPICKKDPDAFFRRISEMGYSRIESCVYFTKDTGEDTGGLWTVKELDEYMEGMEKYGLSMTSFHAFGDLLDEFEELTACIEKYDLKQVVVNCPQENLLEKYLDFAAMCKTLGEKLSACGIELWIHNSTAEIREKVNGHTVLEEILEICGGAAGLQMDVGWAQYGGAVVMDYIAKTAPYLKSIHYKDLKSDYRQFAAGEAQACLGKGCVDTRAVQEYADAHGLPQLVDQDVSDGDIMEDLKYSYDFLTIERRA